MANGTDNPPLEMNSIVQVPATVEEDEPTDPLMMRRRRSDARIGNGRQNRGQQTQAYDIHKGIAKTAIDISLITANANQLRLLIFYNNRSQTYIACITLVIVSLVLQVLVTSGMIIVQSQPKSTRSPWVEQLKIVTSIGEVIITVINILVASLVVTDGPAIIVGTTSSDN